MQFFLIWNTACTTLQKLQHWNTKYVQTEGKTSVLSRTPLFEKKNITARHATEKHQFHMLSLNRVVLPSVKFNIEYITYINKQGDAHGPC